MDQQLFTQQYTKTFSNIFPNYESFEEGWNDLELPETFTDINFLKTIYILLMGEYGFSSIMSMSEDLFKVKLFTRIMAYGGHYEREFNMQRKLLTMTDEELQVSSKAIFNTSINPSEAPTTDTLDELTTINQQNVTKHKRSLLDAYSYLTSLLDDSITKTFVKRFNDLFVRVLRTNNPLYYITVEEDENE